MRICKNTYSDWSVARNIHMARFKYRAWTVVCQMLRQPTQPRLPIILKMWSISAYTGWI